MKRLFLILASVAGLAVCNARVITVDDDGPADFDNIQAAIDDANDGDTVLVADGTYHCPWPDGITFRGKAITVRSENGPQHCVVDGRNVGRCFIFESGEDANSVLDGFTITNGRETGAGIYCTFSSPTVINCVITNNTAPIVCHYSGLPPYCGPLSGGGIACSVAAPLIVNCIITNNTSAGDGAGVLAYTRGDPNNAPILRNCIVSGNDAAGYGDGLYYCQGEIANCVIANNGGHGLRHCGNRITNCIVWANGDDLSKYTYATYSCIEDGDAGEGNIAADPCFADPNNGDYHLISQAGRWDRRSETWVIDDVTSPCIDAGDPMSSIGPEPFPNGGIINMGAYGGTAEASKSYLGKAPCETIVAGDVNGDCIVDFRDLAIALMHWLEQR